MNGLKNSFKNFMKGRYGGDELGEALKNSSAVFLVISIILSFLLKESKIPYIPFFFAIVFFVSFLFRYFSKNKIKRGSENYLFMAGVNKKGFKFDGFKKNKKKILKTLFILSVHIAVMTLEFQREKEN